MSSFKILIVTIITCLYDQFINLYIFNSIANIYILVVSTSYKNNTFRFVLKSFEAEIRHV